jgi:hypothetical protein
MSDVSIRYKGAEIAALDDSGTKTLLTQGKYCEGDIEVAYTKPSGGTFEVDEVREYTQMEDWSTDALGNCKNFADTYMDTGTFDHRFRFAYVYNNSWSGNYKASVFWLLQTGNAAWAGGGCFQNSYPSRGYNASNSWRISAGSVIRVLFLKSIYRDSSEAAP